LTQELARLENYMRYSGLTQRIAGEGAAAWQIHNRALEMREQGVDVLLLSVGDPDFDTPKPIVQAAINSLLAGDTHYPEVRGSRGLRDSIARRHRRRSGQVRCIRSRSACSIRGTK
jgi:arginine:pyruvate transaminase